MAQVSPHEEKMYNLQKHLRQNQSELTDYLADLDSWEGDIKKKEENLKAGQMNNKTSDLPPVRNTIHRKKLKKKKKEKPADDSQPPKTKKISGFDFRAWDKFDVDKALDEIDNEDENKKRETSSSEYETDEEWEMERKKHLAAQEKEKGNAFLKKGDIELAIEAYSKGIGFDPTNAILAANRAMALIKQQKFAAAEFDCTSSIALDPMYVKAYLRRATARAALGKLEAAVADYNTVLDLEPNNKQAKTELERMNKELNRDEEEPVATSLVDNERGRVKPVYKPPEERSKKPLFRVAIEEIGLETVVRPAPSSEQSELAKRITAKEKEEFDKLFTSGKTTQRDGTHEGSTSNSSDVTVTFDRTSGDKSNKVDVSGSNDFSSRTESKPGVELSSSSKAKNPESTQQPRTSTDTSRVTSPAASTSCASTRPAPGPATSSCSNDVSGDSSCQVPLPTPQSSFQFQADFKQLKNKTDAFFTYFQAIPPHLYPKLFGQSFDADILTTILKALSLHPDQIDLFNVLHNLSLVKRFSMTAMFLSKKDKEVARGLIDTIRQSGDHTDSEVDRLKKTYDV